MTTRIFRSPAQYIQGKNAIHDIGAYVKDVSQQVVVMADETVFDIVGNDVVKYLEEAAIKVEKVVFNGESSREEIERIAKVAKDTNATAIVGVGGGKTLDTSKAISDEVDGYTVIVPTTASTDAPTSALSVVYSNEGVFEGYRFYKKNPDLVLVDTQVIAQAPAQFLVGGIADALATWVEARSVMKAKGKTMAGGSPTIAAHAIAKTCEETLFKYAHLAYDSVKVKSVTPALEAVVEANTLLSGLGFESGGLGAAHAIHNGFTALEGDVHQKSHGEKVAFGTLVQLTLEDLGTEEVERYIQLYVSLGLPVTLEELNLKDVSREDILKVAKTATAEGETIHEAFNVTAEDVVDAIFATDQYAKSYKEKLTSN